MSKSNGMQKKTRQLMRKSPRYRGKVPATQTLREFEVGSRTAIKINPSIQKGRPHKRFQGLVGVVQGKQGDAFVLKVKVGDTEKTVISRAEHLRDV